MEVMPFSGLLLTKIQRMNCRSLAVQSAGMFLKSERTEGKRHLQLYT